MRRQAAINSKAIASKAREAERDRREAERAKQAEVGKTKLAEAAEKAENLARLGITIATKSTPPNLLHKLTATPTPSLLHATGVLHNTPSQPSPTPPVPETLTPTATTGEQ